tara:strand:+ start:135 stop:1016 length:882 start_codon:yes stop_codon:yes gene_type:complete
MIIWLASYPKSGNTWVRTIINQIIFNDVKSKDEVFDNLSRIKRYPSKTDIIGLPQISNTNSFTKEQKKEVIDFTVKYWQKSQENINKNNKINILKTHNMLCNINLDGKDYSFTNLENTIGVIHIVRDPRNIVTSAKNHFSLSNEEESVEMICDNYNWTGFTDNEVPQLLSSWANHYNSWKKFPKNNLLIKYEDLVSDVKKEVLKIIEYLSNYFEYKISDKVIEEIERNTSFENFKELENVGKFDENSINEITGEKKTFFNLGPHNNWKKILKKESVDKIETQFNNEMSELGYL